MPAGEERTPHIAEPDRRRSAFGAVGCAQRILPFVTAFGTAQAHDLCARLLLDLWKPSKTINDSAAEIWAKAIHALPEAYANDPDGPSYWSMRALVVVEHALNAARPGGPAQAADWAGEAAIDLCGSADFVISGARPRRMSEEELAQRVPGPCKQGEIDAQSVSMRLMTDPAVPTADLSTRLRDLSRAAAVRLARRLPEFARRQGWDA